MWSVPHKILTKKKKKKNRWHFFSDLLNIQMLQLQSLKMMYHLLEMLNFCPWLTKQNKTKPIRILEIALSSIDLWQVYLL